VLAPFAAVTAADIYPLWSDFPTVRFTNWTILATQRECAERLKRVAARYAEEPRHFGPYAIRTERFVGLAGAELREDTVYEVWYALVRDAWGQGIATRAVGELLAIMEASGRAERAMATAVTENVASWRLLERHGFKRDRLIPRGHMKHGEGLDLYSYSKKLG
jgi:[ribosomal protein S5]-alanine N-acetyltransferase